jgi:hypothetical protein
MGGRAGAAARGRVHGTLQAVHATVRQLEGHRARRYLRRRGARVPSHASHAFFRLLTGRRKSVQ